MILCLRTKRVNHSPILLDTATIDNDGISDSQNPMGFVVSSHTTLNIMYKVTDRPNLSLSRSADSTTNENYVI